MHAGFRLHGRQRVQRVFHFVAFVRYREKVGVGYDVQWIARFLLAHPVANGGKVVTVNCGKDN